MALLLIVAASVAALAGNRTTGPAGGDRAPSTPTAQAHDEVPQPRAVDPVEDVARAYSLAARNWTASSYAASWQRQIDLAGGGCRRALRARRPGRRELAAMRQDRVRIRARVLRAERDRRMRRPDARVLVTLDESTHARGQVVRGITVNEVTLREEAGRWRVVGWTVIPGA